MLGVRRMAQVEKERRHLILLPQRESRDALLDFFDAHRTHDTAGSTRGKRAKRLRFTARDVQDDPRIVFQRLSEQVMEKIAALQNPREE